jgi:hypothetical protein
MRVPYHKRCKTSKHKMTQTIFSFQLSTFSFPSPRPPPITAARILARPFQLFSPSVLSLPKIKLPWYLIDH